MGAHEKLEPGFYHRGKRLSLTQKGSGAKTNGLSTYDRVQITDRKNIYDGEMGDLAVYQNPEKEQFYFVRTEGGRTVGPFEKDSFRKT